MTSGGMVSGGIDLVTVMEILGHATIQMTMRYAHPTPENKRHAVEVLSGLLRNHEEQGQQLSEKTARFVA
jgi:integrase